VRFEGKGIEKKRRITTGGEALVAGVYGFFACEVIAGALLPSPPSWVANLIFVLSLAAAIGFGAVAILRRCLSLSRLANSDFRFVIWIQDFPLWYLKVLVIGGFLGSFWALTAPESFLGHAMPQMFLGLVLFFPSFYYATRFYSSEGFTRVYLLRFLEERTDSDTCLEKASKRLNQALNNLGLRVRPYEFRAGVTLGLMRGTLDDSKLCDLANSIVNIGRREDDKNVIQTVEEILRQVRPKARLLPLRPMKDLLTADLMAKIVTLLAALAAIIKTILETKPLLTP
jgi:hypothetical protein